MNTGESVSIVLNGHQTKITCVDARPQKWQIDTTLKVQWQNQSNEPPA